MTQRGLHGVGQQRAIVANDQLPAHFDAECIQLIGDVQRIGVNALRGQHLRPHRDDLGVPHSVEERYGTGQPSMRASTLNSELLVATITDFDGENASPTMAGPDRNNSAFLSGEILTTPRRPPSDAATYRFP